MESFKEPEISNHLKGIEPSSIRLAQIEFSKRNDDVRSINLAIWNVNLPMHPKMRERMFNLKDPSSPFSKWVNRYTSSLWEKETQEAFSNILSSSGIDTKWLFFHIVDWWSMWMELVVLWVWWGPWIDENPLLLIDAAYTNYSSFAKRLWRKIVSVKRTLNNDWSYDFPEIEEIESEIIKKSPAAMVIIPYDNPTWHLYKHEDIVRLSQLCVKHGMWIISDEAYRELHYDESESVSIWKLKESEVPWITWRRISIETASKVWNACWLRIWAIVTDNKEMHEKLVAEYTANLCANSIWQYIFWALAHENISDLQKWYRSQKDYYSWLMKPFYKSLKDAIPGIIISKPDASIYSVIDFKNIVWADFDCKDFVLFCAKYWNVTVWWENLTLLIAPMEWFYNVKDWEYNPWKAQARIAYVENDECMKSVPELLNKLLIQYNSKKECRSR